MLSLYWAIWIRCMFAACAEPQPCASVRKERRGKASFNQEIHFTFLTLPPLRLLLLSSRQTCVETEVLNYPEAVRQKHLVGF